MGASDPRRDGQTTSPPETLDYERLTAATDMTLEWDIHVDGGSLAEARKRFDMDAVEKLAVKRADETSGQWSTASPRVDEILKMFIRVWAEGLMHGIVFAEQRKFTSFMGKLPDHNLLGATSSIIGGQWGEGAEREAQWAQRIDPNTLTHVAWVQSVQAIQVHNLDRPTPLELRSTQAALWTHGFLMGFLFGELGGHREG